MERDTSRPERCISSRQPARKRVPIPATLMKTYGHADCGVYGEVIAAGTVRPGDRVKA